MRPERVRSEKRLENARFESVRLENVKARLGNVKEKLSNVRAQRSFWRPIRQGICSCICLDRTITQQSINSSVNRGLKINNSGNILSGNASSERGLLIGLAKLGSIAERSSLKDLTRRIRIKLERSNSKDLD